MTTTRITVKKVSDLSRKVACSKCNRNTNHKVLSQVEYYWDAGPGADIQGYDYYETISCLGCEDISFRLTSSNSEDVDEDENGNLIHTESEEIFPSRLAGRPPLEDQHILPFKIRDIYKETHAALSTKLKILAGVGIGALIEAICLAENATGSNLKEKIDDLVKKAILTKNNAEILHKTRFLRNRSAHEIEAAKDPELSIAFDILENLLQTIYIIPAKARGLRE